MKRSNTRIVCTLTGSVLIATYAPKAKAQSDAQRQSAYEECSNKFQDRMNSLGASFIYNGVTGNWVAAGLAWGDMVITSRPDCIKFLSPAQQEAVRKKSALDSQQRMIDRMPK